MTQPTGQTGMGVDKQGNPVADPTANVLALVEAADKRQDDLRRAESRRVDEQMALRAEHGRQLREAEAKRIDAIRAVDVSAVSVDRERAAAAASVLANQVATSAETLRALVATTAAAQATQSAQQFAQLSERIASLEKSAYEGAGKGLATDPLMAQMMADVKAMRGTAGGGMTAMLGWIVSAVVIAGGLVSLVIALN
jgi:hypothetical protein